METIIIHPKTKEQVSLFEQLAKTLKVPFEKTAEKKAGSRYNPEFVAKIERSRKNFKEGKYKIIKTAELWK